MTSSGHHTAAFDVFAVRFGTYAMPTAECFYGYDPADADRTHQLDYFFWLVRGPSATVLLDCGFNRASGERRNRTMLVDPVDALAELGVSPADVDVLVLSHCHYDHVGNVSRFPRAEVVVQKSEVDFWARNATASGRAHINRLVERDDLETLAVAREQGRLRLVEGDSEVTPGIRLNLVGGHTPGSQVLVVAARSGPVVLASDALHLLDELSVDRPFAAFVDLEHTYDAYDRLRRFRDELGWTVVPGHDPQVLNLFPQVSASGVAVSLNAPTPAKHPSSEVERNNHVQDIAMEEFTYRG